VKVFISHNKADKTAARLLASAFTLRGAGVWFDAWNLKPGDSIVGGIEDGLAGSGVFVLIWSDRAVQSNWVEAEICGYFGRKMRDPMLKIIPIMLDDTPLPVLICDYKGFRVTKETSLEDIVVNITGQKTDRDLAVLLQERFHEIAANLHAPGGGIQSYRVCPHCGSTALKWSKQTDYKHDDLYLVIQCGDCHWNDADPI
jgi:hypothetical protein